MRKRSRKRRILFCETGQVFDSQKECALVTSVPQSCISLCLNGKKKSYKGLHFTYVY